MAYRCQCHPHLRADFALVALVLGKVGDLALPSHLVRRPARRDVALLWLELAAASLGQRETEWVSARQVGESETEWVRVRRSGSA